MFIGGEPDRLVMDTEGNVWIALWNKGCVLCFEPDGELIREVRSNDAKFTTCPAWAGENLDILFCTSAKLWGTGGSNGGKLWTLILWRWFAASVVVYLSKEIFSVIKEEFGSFL